MHGFQIYVSRLYVPVASSTATNAFLKANPTGAPGFDVADRSVAHVKLYLMIRTVAVQGYRSLRDLLLPLDN